MSAVVPTSTPPRDRFGRPVRDLRVSVTDRCNFRCRYCMPREVFGADFEFLPRSEILHFGEIRELVRMFRRLGVEKVRLTGGEPLLRRDLPRLVSMLAEVPGLELALTTNGSLLARQAQTLADAGLSRITVSLDSLDEEVFARMNDTRVPVAQVLAGIEAAAAAGLAPIKINAVVRRGVNDHTVVDLARHFKGTGHIVRFIEFMDVGTTNGWRMAEVVPGREVVERIGAELPLEAVPPNYPGEVARRFRYADGEGEIGLITSVTQPFCGGCTRARLSAEGKLYTCLFATEGTDLRALLRGDATNEEIQAVIEGVWRGRGDRYSERRSAETGGGAGAGEDRDVVYRRVGDGGWTGVGVVHARGPGGFLGGGLRRRETTRPTGCPLGGWNEGPARWRGEGGSGFVGLRRETTRAAGCPLDGWNERSARWRGRGGSRGCGGDPVSVQGSRAPGRGGCGSSGSRSRP